MKNKITYIISAIGVIASILGLVTIFFPDLLNLQKKSIPTFKYDSISDFGDSDNIGFKKFSDFLIKQEIGKIFKLDVILETNTDLFDIWSNSNDKYKKLREMSFEPSDSNHGFILFPSSEANDMIGYGLASVAKKNGYIMTFIGNPVKCKDMIMEESHNVVKPFDICVEDKISLHFYGNDDDFLFSFGREFSTINGYYKLVDSMYSNLGGWDYFYRAVPKIEAFSETNL